MDAYGNSGRWEKRSRVLIPSCKCYQIQLCLHRRGYCIRSCSVNTLQVAFFSRLNHSIQQIIINYFSFRYISHLCYYSNNTEVVSGCLEALDAIMCYSNLQSDSLQTFIIALCRSVNVETYCQTSWKVQITIYMYRNLKM